ncbi:hypothetical protein Tco_1217112 [Tanacetum coccineum]
MMRGKGRYIFLVYNLKSGVLHKTDVAGPADGPSPDIFMYPNTLSSIHGINTNSFSMKKTDVKKSCRDLVLLSMNLMQTSVVSDDWFLYLVTSLLLLCNMRLGAVDSKVYNPIKVISPFFGSSVPAQRWENDAVEFFNVGSLLIRSKSKTHRSRISPEGSSVRGFEDCRVLQESWGLSRLVLQSFKFDKVRFSFVSGFKKSDYLEYKVYQGFRIEVERSKL